MIKVKSFKKLKGNSKKYEITFEKNGKMYVRKFGAAGMSDYTLHKDKERRERYISRHKKDLRTNDPMKPGYLSLYILWNKPSVKASLADYKRRLNIYNKTGKFPKDIVGSKKLSFGSKYQVFGMKKPFETQMILSSKVGWDPARVIIENSVSPQLQKLARGYLARSFVKSTRYLKMILLAINIDYYKRKRVANPEQRAQEQMIPDSGTPWNALDVRRTDTAFFLNKCVSVLRQKDIHDDTLWYNCFYTCLVQISNLDPEYNTYPRNISINIQSCIDSIIDLLPNITEPPVYPDLDTERWYERALIEIEENEQEMGFGKSKVPDNVVNKSLYANVKSKIKRSIKGRRWGAYDSGRLVREYKAAGGKYKGSKGKTNLSRWYKEKWVDACAWPKRKPCGRKTKESITYCRPSKKVDSKTPKLVQKLTAAQRKSRCARKKKSPMKRITKFGYTTPDEDVGNGWVIHCNHVPGIGPHATLRQKQLAGPTREGDWAFRYGIKTRGQPPEFWAAGDDPLGPKSGTGLPNVRGQQLLMDYFYDKCGGYNTRQFPPKSPLPGPSLYLNEFGNKKKLKQDMYNDIFLSPNKDMVENVRLTLIKRCPNANIPRLSDPECKKRIIELLLSIYYTMVKNGDINLNTSRKKDINVDIRKEYKYYDPPSFLKLRKKHLINEFLTGLQGGYYGMIFEPKLANNILESIVT